MYSAAHNSFTCLDSDFVGPRTRSRDRAGVLIFLPSIDFGHLDFKLFWVTRTRIQLAPSC